MSTTLYTVKTSANNAKVFQVTSGQMVHSLGMGDIRASFDTTNGTITMSHKQQRDLIFSSIPFAQITNGDLGTPAPFANIGALQTWVENHCFPS